MYCKYKSLLIITSLLTFYRPNVNACGTNASIEVSHFHEVSHPHVLIHSTSNVKPNEGVVR